MQYNIDNSLQNIIVEELGFVAQVNLSNTMKSY